MVGSAWPPETFLARLFRGLSAAGIEMRIALARRPDPAFSEAGLFRVDAPSWSGTPARRLGRLAVTAARGWLRAPREMRAVRRQAARVPRLAERLRIWNRLTPFAGRPFDVVYVPWNSAAIDHLGLFDFGRPVVISCRGSQVHVAPHDPQRGTLREGLRETFAKAAAVHCVSQATLDAARRWGLDPARAQVIHPAVDPEFFRPAARLRTTSQTFEIVMAGSLVGVKGYEYAIMAMRRLVDRRPAARLRIIGDGPERARVQFTIHDLGLDSHVELLGRQTPEAVRDQLRGSDAFLLSSLSEGISNAALEAMACGLPVVTTDAGGMEEAVTDGREGLVIPVAEPAAMAEALERMASDPSIRARMGASARAKVVEQFDLRSQIGKFVTLFEGVAGCPA